MTKKFETYKSLLLQTKEKLMNQASTMKSEFNEIDKSRGDESDQSVAHQEEHTFLITQNRLKWQIMEIEYALFRIEKGTFGLCEETMEPIEEVRLRAIPWTRFSIEGAEINEESSRKPRRQLAPRSA